MQYLRHALHVQLDEVSLVVLQDGQAHPEDDLQALRTSQNYRLTRVRGTALPRPRAATCFSYLVHEDVKDARGHRQRQEGEEEGEEPGRGVHGRVETLRSEVDVELRQLLLR